MRCFRSKLGHSNEKVYLKLIDRRLKILLKEGLHSFLRPTTSELRQFFRTSLAAFLIKRKHKYKTLKHFLSNKHNEKAPAISRSTKKTAMQCLKMCHNIAQNLNMSKMKMLIYILGKYNLQNRIVSFPAHEKLLKEVDSA